MDNAERWLIVGASGGIGHALAQAAKVNDPSVQIIGTSSGREGGDSQRDPRLFQRLATLDFLAPETVTDFARWCNDELASIDRLICATGILSDEGIRPEKRVADLSADAASRTMQVNAIGPMLLLAALEPLLKRSRNTKVVLLSALVGSISENALGGWYSYRMSKAALNMGVKTIAIEYSRWRHGPTVAAVHPGTTHTRLSAPFTQRRKIQPRAAHVTADELYDLLDTLGPAHHGGFFNTRLEKLPW